MAGCDAIREVIAAMLESAGTRGKALDMACELSELERRACFGSELARLDGFRMGLKAAGAVRRR